jgi:TfoX/Sxy family transcriptional regulator of competence genes
MMAYAQHHYTALKSALLGQPDLSERKMFGGVCFMLSGNMLCCVSKDRYMFRVGKEIEAEALRRPGASPMIHNNRAMGGFIWVDAGVCDAVALQSWAELALDYVTALPAK